MNHKLRFFHHSIVVGCIGWWAFACGDERKAAHPHLSQLTGASQEVLGGKAVKEWQLHEGQSVQLKSGAALTLIKVRDDSRCAEGNLCFRDERLVAEFLLETTKRRRSVYLGLNRDEHELIVEGQAIQLVAISPNLTVDRIPEPSYRVSIRQTTAKIAVDLEKELEGIRLATLYNPDLGVIELEFINGQASLIRDANRCQVDAFGDRFACTKMAVFRSNVGFQLMEQSVNKYLYQLTGIQGFSFVVDHSYNIPSYRLLVQRDDYVSVEALLPIQKVKQLP